MLLVFVAAALGADCSFAMAVAEPTLAGAANPSDNMDVYDATTNPTGRPAEEALQGDEHDGKTQLQGKPATATDVRDAGLEAEDYDAEVDNFRKFRFPIETYVARKCRPVKCNSYVHGHYRSGSTYLEATYIGATAVSITNASKVIQIPAASFDNADCLTEYSTVSVRGVSGYKKDESGNEVTDGELVLFVMNHKDGNDNVKFMIVNPPVDASTSVSIASGTSLFVMATACSESQMRVASETYLPEKHDVYLQKKIVTCIITDEFEGQDKKVSLRTRQVLANAEYNFKRKCARSHWNGTMGATDIIIPETGGRERVYFEGGILRQVPMLYTLAGDAMVDDDLLAISTLQFTNNSMSDSATAFCGKKMMARFIKLINSSAKYRDVSKVVVDKYGIKVREYIDNFGKITFVWDPTLDDLGYEDFMVVLDLDHATRPYKRNDSKTTQDMKETGEAREAKAHNLCRIDCVALNGYNAILVCPAASVGTAIGLGGVNATFTAVATLSGQGAPTDLTLKYYLTADDATAGFEAGTVVEWDADLGSWVEYNGLL